jgi:hypothetical protein
MAKANSIPPAFEHIGASVMFHDGGEWVEATIYFAIDDEDMHASLTVRRPNVEAEYVEDVPHSSATKGKRFWMWPLEADTLRSALDAVTPRPAARGASAAKSPTGQRA